LVIVVVRGGSNIGSSSDISSGSNSGSASINRSSIGGDGSCIFIRS
jgi:hypothetical protein